MERRMEGVAAARLIACERTDSWTVALRWALAGSSIGVCQLHDPRDCWPRLEAAPASVVMLELGGRSSAWLGESLVELRRRFPLARSIVMGEPVHAAALWLARELGAAHVVTSTRNLTSTVNLIRKHFALVAEGATRDDGAGGRGAAGGGGVGEAASDFRQQVWNRMPWNEFHAM